MKSKLTDQIGMSKLRSSSDQSETETETGPNRFSPPIRRTGWTYPNDQYYVSQELRVAVSVELTL